MEPGRRHGVTLAVEAGGFRFPRVEDVDGEVVGQVTDEAERDRLLGFLRGGSVVLATDWYVDDRIDPANRYVVRDAYRTDGTWIWPHACEYYLHRHGLGLDPDFRHWIESRGHLATPVGEDVTARALAAVKERLAVFREQLEKAREAARQEAAERRSKVVSPLPETVQRMLEGIGWWPGRDVSDQVDAWLGRVLDDVAALPFERDGYPRYEPFPAATAVLGEFGGLGRHGGGRGISSATVPFMIFPADGDDDLMRFAVATVMLGDHLGCRTFQIGEVERGQGALVIDEKGRIFAVGPADLHLGADIHEALERMIRGIRADSVYDIDP